MLRELLVRDLASIEDLRVELEAGFCVWTGETGAGKSLLLAALGLVLGGRASADLVRAGRSEAIAVARFDLGDDAATRTRVESILGRPLENGCLTMTRRLPVQGRASGWADDRPVSVSVLRALGDILIDLHGQRDGRDLLDPSRRREWLDSFGRTEGFLAAYRDARSRYEDLMNRRRVLLAEHESRIRGRDRLLMEAELLEGLAPREGEYARLQNEAKRLGSLDRIRSACLEANQMLYEAERSAQGLLSKAARKLEGLEVLVPDLGRIAADLVRMAGDVREAAQDLQAFANAAEDAPGRVDSIEARLAEYRRVASRLRLAPEDLAARWSEVGGSLQEMEDHETNLRELDLPRAVAWTDLSSAASRLTTARRRASQRFVKEVKERLTRLGLGEAKLSIVIETAPLGEEPQESPPPDSGIDRVDFAFAPNAGEPARSLGSIASGGELSRITLAIKAALAGAGRTPTLIFDEIDTGVGGRLGRVLGEMLAELADHHQVICVTHLPQLASHARRQWVIRKSTARGRTRTTIDALTEAERVDELAAMLRGDSAAEGTRREALSMLDEARTGPRRKRSRHAST
ncbi:MAG: DNA repair protein RecN [Isosphaeraceae bacterium]|nr:DNA repair protein RecN [Isosphaeraceae bacterium]